MLIEAVAEHLECSTSKISRLETGKGIPKARDVRDMLTLYGVNDPKVRDRFARWTREGQQQGWWHDFPGVINDERKEAYVALESDAATMRSYEATLVHGLLQVPDYARALGRVILPEPTDGDIETFVELRMHRQDLLSRPESPLRLHVIMEEPVLYRPVGGDGVMRGQLDHLLEVGTMPNVTIQILPLRVGVHPAVSASFALLAFADDMDHGVVLTEGVGGAVVLEHARDVANCTRAFEDIQSRALNPEKSAEFIASVLRGTDQI